jgi:hypothetical protein
MLSSFSGSFFAGRRKTAAGGGGGGEVDPALSIGTEVSWTSGTMFDTWTSPSSATTNGGNSVVNVWQMFYAHRSIRLTSGKAGLRIGTATSGTNSWTWGYAVSSANNTRGSFGSVTTIGTQSTGYVSGGTYTANISSTVTVPANRYFLIGRRVGPFYYASRTLADNRTATISGVPYFTVINQVWAGGSTDSFSIPSQLGGVTSYTQTNSISQVAGFLFDVV